VAVSLVWERIFPRVEWLFRWNGAGALAPAPVSPKNLFNIGELTVLDEISQMGTRLAGTYSWLFVHLEAQVAAGGLVSLQRDCGAQGAE